MDVRMPVLDGVAATSGGCQVRFGDCDRSLHPGKRTVAVGGGGGAGRQFSAEGGALTLTRERVSTRSPKPTSCRTLRPGTCLSGYLG